MSRGDTIDHRGLKTPGPQVRAFARGMQAVSGVQRQGGIEFPGRAPRVAHRQQKAADVGGSVGVRTTDAIEILGAAPRGPDHVQRRSCAGALDLCVKTLREFAQQHL